jgi:hypothetical protein
MPSTQTGSDKKRGGPKPPAIEPPGERSSPGSGEDDTDGAADLQPDEVEDGDTAR